jgi:hypothetical protein
MLGFGRTAVEASSRQVQLAGPYTQKIKGIDTRANVAQVKKGKVERLDEVEGEAMEHRRSFVRRGAHKRPATSGSRRGRRERGETTKRLIDTFRRQVVRVWSDPLARTLYVVVQYRSLCTYAHCTLTALRRAGPLRQLAFY